MRRNDTIRRPPQLMLLRQRFRIRDIQRRAPQALQLGPLPPFPDPLFELPQRSNQGLLHEDLPARDITHERVPAGQDVEFLFPEQVRGGGGEGHGDEEDVDVLGEEIVEGGFVEAAVPGAGDRAVGVAGVGDDEAGVAF